MTTSRTEVVAARRVLACVSHDLSGTLQALFTYLRVLERQAPSAQLSAALAAATRLRDEVQGLRETAQPAAAAPVDLQALVREVRGVDPARLRVVLHGGDATVSGHGGALGQALGGLVRAVAASLRDADPVQVTLSAGEREVRVLVGDDGADGDERAFDPLVADAAERAGLDVLLAAVALESHGGRLLRAGAPGAWRFEAVVPRSAA